MNCKILSLNVGGPEKMTWLGRSVLSSMNKKPISGPLLVTEKSVNEDFFASQEHHGTVDSILYAFGFKSIQKYLAELSIQNYEPGGLGENITVDDLPESEISVGDIFQIGEVKAQVTGPRVPCGKLNYRLQTPDALKAMQVTGCCGIYFRILKPGKIQKTDSFERTKQALVPFAIPELYGYLVRREVPSPEVLRRIQDNGAFSSRLVQKWTS